MQVIPKLTDGTERERLLALLEDISLQDNDCKELLAS